VCVRVPVGAAALLLAKLGSSLGWSFPVAPLVAVVGATALGLLVGLPALRIRRIQLAIVATSITEAEDLGAVVGTRLRCREFADSDSNLAGRDLGLLVAETAEFGHSDRCRVTDRKYLRIGSCCASTCR